MLHKFLPGVHRMLIAGLPEKYGSSLDFAALACALDADLVVADEREEALLQFAGLLRRVLAVNRETADETTLAEEMALVDDYLSIERLRLGERLRITRDLSPEALACWLPVFSVQALVENAIQHAVAPRRDGGRVPIRGLVREGRLEITVADDGPGAEAASVAQAKGVGLDVIRRRLRARHGDRATLQVDTAPGKGFRVTLVLPATREEGAA